MARAPTATWKISSSLALELDFALSFALTPSLGQVLEAYAPVLSGLPEDWAEEGRRLVRGLPHDVWQVLTRLAAALEVVEVSDYGPLTLALRSATRADLHRGLARQLRRLRLEDPADFDPSSPDAMASALDAVTQASQVRLGYRLNAAGRARIQRECRLAIRILRDGDLGPRFWHWVDRFYYERYASWRQSRQEAMAIELARARAALGGDSGRGRPPLDWLVPQNPLRLEPRLIELLVADGCELTFWREPFGLWDSLVPTPEGGLVAFGPSTAGQRALRHRAELIAARLKALADPTRLTILRFIRSTDFDNATMAGYLEVSEPTVSIHVKQLRELGLIRSERRGRSAFHELDEAAFRELFADLETFVGLARAKPEEER